MSDQPTKGGRRRGHIAHELEEIEQAEQQTQVDIASLSQLVITAKELIKSTRGSVRAIDGKVDKILAGLTSPKQLIVVAAGSTIHFPGLTPIGDTKMPTYSLARDHADEPFTLDPITVTDSEGDVEFTDGGLESDNPAVVAVDAAASTVHFGTFGTATLSRKITAAGNSVSVGEPSVFNLSPGALTITGGGVTFPNLTPDA